MLRKTCDAFIGLTHAPAPLEAEGFGHDANGQSTHFPGDFGHDRGCPGAGATTHPRGNEHQVGPLQRVVELRAGLLSSFLTDRGVAAGPQTSGSRSAPVAGDVGPETESAPGHQY